MECSYSHHSLGHSGEHSGPERVQQDLVLQQDKVQQCGAVLRAQIHQQSPVVCPADGEEEAEHRGCEWGDEFGKQNRKQGRGDIREVKSGKENWCEKQDNSVNNSHFNLKLLLIHVFKLNTQTSLPHPNTPSPYNIMQCNNSARHARFVRFIMETVRFNLTVRSKEAKEKRKGKTNLTFAGSSCLNVRICWFSLSNMMVRGKSLGFLCIFLIFDIWQTKW